MPESLTDSKNGSGPVKLIVTLSTAVAAILVGMWLVFHRHHASTDASLSVTGQLVAYAAGPQDLTLRTETGERHFIVHEGTPVNRGARRVSLADLTTAGGCRAKVWYRDRGQPPVAREVRISCESIAPPVPP